jgi:hypothetical protein
MRSIWTIVAIGLLLGNQARAAEFLDEFGAKLDESRWCTCQMDNINLPVELNADPNEQKDHIAGIRVNEDNAGERECGGQCDQNIAAFEKKSAVSESTEPLTYSLITPSGPVWRPEKDKVNPYCTPEVWAKIKPDEKGVKRCIQRQELRLQDANVVKIDVPHIYSFRFRMPKEPGDKVESLRWITAQWKSHPSKNEDASPFLAQRYDDGVLNITVQNDSCRCLVASAPLPDGSNYAWTSDKASYCESLDAPPDKPERCESGLEVEYGDNPILTSPAGTWTEMRYQVQAGTGDKSMIEVHQDGRFIVRVTGHIGYDPPSGMEQTQKFKIGHYRNYMPFNDLMEIDWIKLEAAK